MKPPQKRATGVGYQPEGRALGVPCPAKAWMPAPFDKADLAAMKAIRDGTATAEQQKRALAWIVQYAARTYDQSYDPGSERDTAFAEGCRHVGLQIVKLLNWQVAVNEEQGR